MVTHQASIYESSYAQTHPTHYRYRGKSTLAPTPEEVRAIRGEFTFERVMQIAEQIKRRGDSN